jgi:hypothetical protein
MGIAAYNRGSRQIARDSDLSAAKNRSTCATLAEHNAQLQERILALECELKRATRCLAAERLGRNALGERLKACERSNEFITMLMCRFYKAAYPDRDSDVE